MLLSGDANWRQVLMPALRELTLLRLSEKKGDYDSHLKQLLEDIDTLYKARAEELAEQLKQEMASDIAEHLWETTKGNDVDGQVAVDAGQQLAENIDDAQLRAQVKALSSLIDSVAPEAFKSVLGRSSRTYYFVDVEGKDVIQVWPGSGRYTEDLRAVLHSAVFKQTTSSPKLLLDRKGSVSGVSLDGDKFTAYSEREFLERFGRARMNEALNAANM